MANALRLVRYEAGESQPAHAHEGSMLSILLAGEFQEECGRAHYDLARPALGWKPAGLRHQNRFGPSGALIASIPVPARHEGAIALAAGWHALAKPERIGPLLRLCLFSPDAAIRRDAILDLLALAGADLAVHPRGPPDWLDRARQMLRDEPARSRIDEIARQLGVHRVHLSRSFTRRFGVSPSVFRQRAMVSRTAALIGGGAPLGQAAHGGDFSDHSHAARAAKHVLGLRLAEVKALLARGYIGSS
jgi:AraC family transcriptional regulator